jgi:4-amino-4-deoxy-L-arabinose transferase-like glycosyltransferase
VTRWAVALVALALARSLLLAVAVPPYQASDEPWHLDYARVVGDGDLPVMGETRLDPEIVEHVRTSAAARRLPARGIADGMSREAFQPPLGYVLPGAAYRLAGGPEGGLFAFRALDALAGAAAAVAALALGRAAFPRAAWAGPVAGLAAVGLPAMAIVSSTANNDAAGVALALAALAVAVRVARDGGSARRHVALGALIGLAALVRATGVLLVVPAAVAVALSPRRDPGWWWSRGAPAVVAAAFPVLAWAGRNASLYDEPTGTGAFDGFGAVPGNRIGGLSLLLGASPDHPEADPFWPELARTTVGVLGWTDTRLDAWAYVLAALAVAVAAVAVARWFVGRGAAPASLADRRATVVVAAAALAYLAGAIWYALTVDYQPQGRYLLPAVLGAAAVLGAPLERRGAGLATGVLGALLVATFVTAARAWA